MAKLRIVSAQEAISSIEPGSLVYIGESCGEPQTLVDALIADKERLNGTICVEMRRFNGSRLASLTDYFRIISLHLASDTYRAAHEGKIDFLPLKLSDTHRLFSSSQLRPDVALVQVSYPDTNALCSFGVSVGATLDAARSAKIVIAEMNELMPRTCGNNGLPVDKFDYIVQTCRPLLEYPPPNIDDQLTAVAANVVKLISDGDTLCLGIGSLTEAVLMAIRGKHNLGVHAGLITNGIIGPIEEGTITNRFKRLDTGKSVSGVAMGTGKLFRFLHENPRVEMRPCSYTHDVRVMERLDNFFFLTTAIEIDLTGQVNAESIGAMQFSAVGGQADFTRGAQLSKGGKSVVAFSSTARGGKTSKIVPRLQEGTAVSTPRYDVQYVVTEYGIAELWGKTFSQRASSLISIAHSDFRDELLRAHDGKESSAKG